MATLQTGPDISSVFLALATSLWSSKASRPAIAESSTPHCEHLFKPPRSGAALQTSGMGRFTELRQWLFLPQTLALQNCMVEHKEYYADVLQEGSSAAKPGGGGSESKDAESGAEASTTESEFQNPFFASSRFHFLTWCSSCDTCEGILQRLPSKDWRWKLENGKF